MGERLQRWVKQLSWEVRSVAWLSRQVRFWVFAMCALGLLLWAFLPTLGFAFVDWDDRHFIVESRYTAAPFADGWRTFLTTPWYGYPIPLVSLTWAVDAALGRGAPWSFHLTNLLLHLANTALIFGVALGWWSVTNRPASDQQQSRLLAAVLVAGSWALHPVVAEPVSWCIGRKDLLCVAASLVSVLGSRFAMRNGGQGWRWLRWLAFAAALGSKPQAVVVPLLWLVDGRVRSGRWDRSLSLEAGLGLAISLVFAFSAFASLTAAGGISSDGRPERIVFALRHLALQAGNYLVPISLAPRYLMDVAGWGAGVAAGAGLLLWLSPALALRRSGWGAATGGMVWVAVCFLPVAGLMGLHRGAADSYFYLPSIGIWLGLQPLVERATRRASGRLFLLALMLALAWGARGQSAIWRNSESLWRRQIQVAPEAVTGWWSLADVYASSGRPREAVAVYELALEVVTPPETPGPYLEMSRGCLLAGDQACAEKWLGAAVSAFPRSVEVALRRVGFAVMQGATLDASDGDGVVRGWLWGREPSAVAADYALVADDASALAALRAVAAATNRDSASRDSARRLLDYGRLQMRSRSGTPKPPLPL